MKMDADPVAPISQNHRPYQIVNLNYVSLYIKDFREAIAFYSQVFGPPESVDAQGEIYGWHMGSTWLTVFPGKAGTFQDGNPRNTEFAIQVSAVEEVDRLHRALIGAGAKNYMPPEDTKMYEPMRFCCVDDPFGVRIDVYCPLGVHPLDRQITPYPDIDEIVSGLLDQIQRILAEKLAGLYLYGSLVSGDFDREISDIDLLAVVSSDIDDQEFGRLQKMHHNFVTQNPNWDNRIEIAYLSMAALKTFRSQVSQIAIISPGEPFHIKTAGKDWLMNWWLVREKGVTLFGPAPTTFIDPISKEEFLQAVQEHAQGWGEWVYQMQDQPGQAYAILTLCRALYASRNGEQVSKKQAALWAQERFPQWASLIQHALLWRRGGRDEQLEHAATFPDIVKFVHFAIDQIAVS
jgi:uncharacterized glyoxalase superfamily protein PhnB/predicted nucleotidyltransferase